MRDVFGSRSRSLALTVPVYGHCISVYSPEHKDNELSSQLCTCSRSVLNEQIPASLVSEHSN